MSPIEAAVRCGSKAAALSLAYDGGEVLRATLRDTVTVASGWEGDVRMRCRLRVPDRAALYAVQRKLQRAETQRMTVSLRAAAARGRRREKKSVGAGCRCRIFEYLWPETRRFTNGFRMMKTIFFRSCFFSLAAATAAEAQSLEAFKQRLVEPDSGARVEIHEAPDAAAAFSAASRSAAENGIAAGASISTPATGRMPASKPRR